MKENVIDAEYNNPHTPNEHDPHTIHTQRTHSTSIGEQTQRKTIDKVLQCKRSDSTTHTVLERWS